MKLMRKESLNLGFDHYTRNFLIAELIDNIREYRYGLRILDVGGRHGRLKEFVRENDEVFVVDLMRSELAEENYFIATATLLPFNDGFFDVVVCSDVYEHIKSQHRLKALSEMLRVGKNFVILGAPFFARQTEEAQLLANEIFLKLNGVDHHSLIQHIKNGLPKTKPFEKFVKQNGYDFFHLGHNNINNWLLMQSLNFYADVNLIPKEKVIEVFKFYNENFPDLGDFMPPHYRSIYLIRKRGRFNYAQLNKYNKYSLNIVKYQKLIYLVFECTKELIERQQFVAADPVSLLMSVYRSRSDIRRAFPEVLDGDYSNLLVWAKHVSSDKGEDSHSRLLQPYSAWYANEVEKLTEIKHRDKHLQQALNELQQQKLEKENLSNQLNTKLEQALNELQQQKLEKENLSNQLNTKLEQALNELHAIKNSVSWKLIRRYENFALRMFPQGTIRGRLHELLLVSLRLMIYHGVRDFFVIATREFRKQKLGIFRPQIMFVYKIQGRQMDEFEIPKFRYGPKISIVMPVYETDPKFLSEAIQSVINQSYKNWELCIVDDGSKKEHVKPILEEYRRKEPRIKVSHLTKNSGIANASNEALSMATGEFVGFLDHDDVLHEDALILVVKYLSGNPDIDFVYTDEDKIDGDCRSQPFFKPDWSPDLLMSMNYIPHFCVYRRALLTKVGGFREGFEGSQDYDLVLRVTEETKKIVHIPKVLYSWRISKTSSALSLSAKPLATVSAQKALSDALLRRGIKGEVLPAFNNWYRIKYVIDIEPLVSIIIITHDNFEFLQQCIESVESKTTYKNYEIIIVDHNSKEKTALNYLASIKHKVIRTEEDFNFAKLNNEAAKHARGSLLLFLNNDIIVSEPNWLTEMVSIASNRADVGVVGAKLLHPDGRIQHAGVILGVGGSAGHAFRNILNNEPGYFGFPHLIRNCSAVTAACMLVKKEIFDRVNGFDEKLKVGGNDVDLCLRIHDLGFLIVYTPYAALYHYEGATRKGQFPLSDYGYFTRKCDVKIKQGDPYYNPNLSLENEDNLFKQIHDVKTETILAASTNFTTQSIATKLIDRNLLYYDFTNDDIQKNKSLINNWVKLKNREVRSINWFLPDYTNVYAGGPYTIFRFIRFFSNKGILNRIIIFGGTIHTTAKSVLADIHKIFPDLRNIDVLVDTPHIPYADISIATFWATAYPLLKFNNTKGKYYFIQDYEPLFYPAGSYYGLAEATYRFGFIGITNGPALTQIYKEQFEGIAEYFVPAVDTELFKPSSDTPRPQIKRVFFYARPAMDRNAFDLGILALEKIKRKYRNIEVVTAGWDISEYNIPLEITNLGVLTLKETAELYRTCDAGLTFMFTKHPSYIPLELLASGCLVITNKNNANTWLLRDKVNCLLTEPTPSSILETFDTALNNYELRCSIHANGLSIIKSLSWEKEMEKIFKFIKGE